MSEADVQPLTSADSIAHGAGDYQIVDDQAPVDLIKAFQDQLDRLETSGGNVCKKADIIDALDKMKQLFDSHSDADYDKDEDVLDSDHSDVINIFIKLDGHVKLVQLISRTKTTEVEILNLFFLILINLPKTMSQVIAVLKTGIASIAHEQLLEGINCGEPIYLNPRIELIIDLLSVRADNPKHQIKLAKELLDECSAALVDLNTEAAESCMKGTCVDCARIVSGQCQLLDLFGNFIFATVGQLPLFQLIIFRRVVLACAGMIRDASCVAVLIDSLEFIALAAEFDLRQGNCYEESYRFLLKDIFFVTDLFDVLQHSDEAVRKMATRVYSVLLDSFQPNRKDDPLSTEHLMWPLLMYMDDDMTAIKLLLPAARQFKFNFYAITYLVCCLQVRSNGKLIEQCIKVSNAYVLRGKNQKELLVGDKYGLLAALAPLLMYFLHNPPLDRLTFSLLIQQYQSALHFFKRYVAKRCDGDKSSVMATIELFRKELPQIVGCNPKESNQSDCGQLCQVKELLAHF